jgi:hypothetical protein
MRTGSHRAIVMPFQRNIKGRPFQPEDVAALSEALAMATDTLGIALDQQTKRELVARLIVQAALDDRSLDADGLCRKAITAFRKSTQAPSE